MSFPEQNITVNSSRMKLFSHASNSWRVAPLILLITDYLAIVLGLISAYYFRECVIIKVFPSLGKMDLYSNFIYGMFPLIYLGLIFYEGLYSKRLPFWYGAERLFKTCFFGNILIIGIIYFTGMADKMSRIFIFTSWFIVFIHLVVFRYFTKKLMIHVGFWQKPVIVIGAGKTAELLSNAFEQDPYMGYKITGVIEDCHCERPLTQRYPLLGTFQDAEDTIQKECVDDVIIAAPGLGREELVSLIYRLQPHVRNTVIVPDLFGVPMSNLEVDTIFNEKIIMLRTRNNLSLHTNHILKRMFDLSASIIGTVLLLPVFLLIMAAIYIESPGKVIFAHKRVGKDGRLFPCFKFRSMVPNAQEILKEYLSKNPSARQEWEQDFKLKVDPRITRIGNFLRKTSLDELPQLINVIRGEMSLVGPRPIITDEISKYAECINDYYLVSPGITGLWQVSGRNDVDYETRVGMDSWYVRNWSIWLDITLLFKTIKVVIKGKGAY